MKEKTNSEPYNKPPLTIHQQITLLKSRGLIVDANDPQLNYYLKNVSYYHLSIYFKFFQRGDIFDKNTTFDDVVRIYTFDNKLRLLLLEILERVEKSFKCRVAYHLSTSINDSHCHTKHEIFINEEKYTEIQEIFNRVYNESKEISIDHYKAKYSKPPLPPIWTMVEILSFGQVVKFVKTLSRQNQNLVSRSFGADTKYILNWMHCLSILRNTCAHHSRLWNREHTFTIKTDHRNYQDLFVSNKRLFNNIVAMQVLLNEINPTSSWQTKLIDLVNSHKIDVKNMGFPDDWEHRLATVKTVPVVSSNKIEK